MVGVRLDSGDVAALSKKARSILDKGGFPNAAVVASDSLDEHRITALRADGAEIAVWGVGTNLATAKDQPALGGVYKLAAISGPGGDWQDRIKLSEIPIKISNPGIQQVRRYLDADGRYVGDLIYDERQPPSADTAAVNMQDLTSRWSLSGAYEDLLVPIFREGSSVYSLPSTNTIRDRALSELSRLPEGVRRLTAASVYPVGLSTSLAATKSALMSQVTKGAS